MRWAFWRLSPGGLPPWQPQSSPSNLNLHRANERGGEIKWIGLGRSEAARSKGLDGEGARAKPGSVLAR
eukprot:4248991-Pleurochrysis_carterae.AAC.2